MYEALAAIGSVMLDPYLLMLIFVTTIGGIVIGVLPGLGATTGAALLLPLARLLLNGRKQQGYHESVLIVVHVGITVVLQR